ncbi:MAG TPA: hypothetical protein VMO17_04270, partial [Terriglobia bacterium]|nr:hypothetical protein [Terriglobia bacterium]
RHGSIRAHCSGRATADAAGDPSETRATAAIATVPDPWTAPGRGTSRNTPTDGRRPNASSPDCGS